MSEKFGPKPLWSHVGKSLRTFGPTQSPAVAAQSSAKKGASILNSPSSAVASKVKRWADYDVDDDHAPTQPSDHLERIAELERQLTKRTKELDDYSKLLQSYTKLNDTCNELRAQVKDAESYIKALEYDKHELELVNDALEQQVLELQEMLQLSVVEQEQQVDEQYPEQPDLQSEVEFAPEQLPASAAVEHAVPEVNESAQKATVVSTSGYDDVQTTLDTTKNTILQLSPVDFPTLSPKSPDGVQSTPAASPTEPVFVTAQTLKQGPAVPPAPVLKMGIDMSKYGKKPASKSAVSPQTKGPQGARSKVDPNIVPKIDPYQDIRKWSLHQREPLANGGMIDILIGKQSFGSVPKYMFMQCSHNANKYFSENPKAKSMAFPAGSMDATALQTHLDWMNQLCSAGAVFSIGLNSSHSDARNLNIMRAARVLGLNNCYVGHFTRQYCDRIRSDDLTYDLMNLISCLAYEENDPVFECLANNIANQYQRNNVLDEEGLARFLQHHKTLAERVHGIRQKAAARKAHLPNKNTDGGRSPTSSNSRL